MAEEAPKLTSTPEAQAAIDAVRGKAAKPGVAKPIDVTNPDPETASAEIVPGDLATPGKSTVVEHGGVKVTVKTN